MDLQILIFSSVIGLILFIVLMLYLFSYKWVNFGIKNYFMRGKLKHKMGYLWIRDSGNNFDLPIIINLNDIKKEIGEDTFHFTRQQLLGTTLFGRPFVMFDNEDNKTSLGLYFHESEEDAEPAYIKIKEGKILKYLLDENGDKIPKLTQIKPAVSLNPAYYKAVITQDVFKNLRKYISDFIGKYKYVLLIVGGIGVGIGIILYFLYNQQESLPQVLEYCKAASDACQVVK